MVPVDCLGKLTRREICQTNSPEIAVIIIIPKTRIILARSPEVGCLAMSSTKESTIPSPARTTAAVAIDMLATARAKGNPVSLTVGAGSTGWTETVRLAPQRLQ